MYAAAGSSQQAAELPKNFNFADEEPLIYERYACLPVSDVLHGNIMEILPVPYLCAGCSGGQVDTRRCKCSSHQQANQEQQAELCLGLSADGRAAAAFSPAAQPLETHSPSVSPRPEQHMLLIDHVVNRPRHGQDCASPPDLHSQGSAAVILAAVTRF